MDDVERLTEVERLLLMSAYLWGFTSKRGSHSANTARVLRRTLRWLGLTPEEISQGIWEFEDDERSDHLRIIGAVYDVLIRMTRQGVSENAWRPQARPGTPLFDGFGNWVEPDFTASPLYNGCKLTVDGDQLARQLLRRYSEYRDEPADDDDPDQSRSSPEARSAWLHALTNDLFGKPLALVSLDPRWLTATVKQLAQTTYDDRDFSRLPILADALEEAGCQQADVLNHLRSGGEHVRGCWALDLVLGRT